MNKKHFAALLILSTSMLIGCSHKDNNSSKTNDSSITQNSSSQEESSSSSSISLSFSSCVLVATENEGELNIKATNKNNVGTMYVALSSEEKDFTEQEIISGNEFIFKFNTDESSFEKTVKDLEAGKEYFAYFVIAKDNTYSKIVKRNATTFKSSIDMGEGTEENPFKIYNLVDLEAVGTSTHPIYNLNFAPSSYYKLMEDIDLSSKYKEGGSSWNPIQLDGYFDGNNHKITSLYINDYSASTNLGLFAQVNAKATLENLTLDGAIIKGAGYKDQARTIVDSLPSSTSTTIPSYSHGSGSYVGTLCGDVKGIVRNCHVLNATLEIDGSRVGGLTGRLYSDEGTSAKISSCSVEASIKGYSRLGGIVGLVDSKSNTTFTQPVIENVTYKGDIVGTNHNIVGENSDEILGIVAGEYIGGIAGYFRSVDLKNAVCYESNINGFRHVGGIVGFQQFNNKAKDHYTLIDNVLFDGTTHVSNGSNAGPIVGNRSNSNTSESKVEVAITNAYYVDESKFYQNETDLTFEGLAETAKFGQAVSRTNLNQEFYASNLSGFDFENIFKLNTNNIPVLK